MSNRERFYEIDQIPGARQQLLERIANHRFEKVGQMVGPQYELPSLRFSAQDIRAVLSMRQLMSNLHVGGLVGPQLRPTLARCIAPIGSAGKPVDEVRRQIRLPTVRTLEFRLYQSCCSPATLGATCPSRGVRTKRSCVTARAALAPSASSREAPLPHELAPSPCATSGLKEDHPKHDFPQGRAWRSR